LEARIKKEEEFLDTIKEGVSKIYKVRLIFIDHEI